MKTVKALLAIGTLAFAGTVSAQTPGLSSVYIGGTLGQSEYKDGCTGVASCDEKDTAWRLLAGYQFNRYFAAELGYHDLGSVSAPGASVDGTAWELVGLGAYPVFEKVSLYGKLGV